MSPRTVMCTTLLLAGVCLRTTPAAAAARCEDLLQLPLSGTRVTFAQLVAAGTLSPAGEPGGDRKAQQGAYGRLPAFCRVMLTSTPTSDSDIKIEVWLPAAGWNGKLQAVGDGALAGFIPFALMAPALAQGYAASGTDTGHVGGNADFMPGHPEKLIDFAYRSTHEMAVAAKAVIASFYGNPPAWSYYNACSGGGRHGLTSAQRYPGDFQGIVAGAASFNQPRLDAGRIGVNLTVNRTPESRMPESKYRMIHDAVLQVCDGADGVRDGVIENPRTCAFDYATLGCRSADGPSCLTPAQVESARVLTSPFRDPATGKVLMEPRLRPGSELEWGRLGGPEPLKNSLARVRNFHLKPFFERGGKLLIWHGWSDPPGIPTLRLSGRPPSRVALRRATPKPWRRRAASPDFAVPSVGWIGSCRSCKGRAVCASCGPSTLLRAIPSRVEGWLSSTGSGGGLALVARNRAQAT